MEGLGPCSRKGGKEREREYMIIYDEILRLDMAIEREKESKREYIACV